MASIFCPSCGSRSEYQFATPNFCFKCGKSYVENKITAKLSESITKTKSSRSRMSQASEEEFEDDNSSNEEEFSNATRVPKLNRLEVEIDSSSDVRVFKFEDLLNGNSGASFPRSPNHRLDDLIDKND